MKIYLVGGSLRDEILGVKSNDIDFAVEADSYAEMKEWIISKGGEIFLETENFLTIRARIGKVSADYVLCRKDSAYGDGRHPDTVEVGDIYDDLARRDFTMNAIAKDMDNGKYLDPHNGIEHINAHIIHCVGNAYDRFSEDNLRMLRALRFSVTKYMYLSYDIDKQLQNVNLVRSLYKTVSIDRVKDELLKMFQHSTYDSLEILNRYPTLADVLWDMADGRLWLKPTLEAR